MGYTDPKPGGYSNGEPVDASELNAFRDAHADALYGDTQMSTGQYVAYSFASYTGTTPFSITTAIARLSGAVSSSGLEVALPTSSVPTGARLSVTCVGNGSGGSSYDIRSGVTTIVTLDGTVIGGAELYWDGTQWRCSTVSGGASGAVY